MTQVRGDRIDLGLRLLDHQLIDSEGMRCGKVDDIEFAEDGGELVVAALLSGPRAQRRRLPRWLARPARWFGSDAEHRVEWRRVKGVEAAVELDEPAEELGLGGGDRNARSLVEWLPRS